MISVDTWMLLTGWKHGWTSFGLPLVVDVDMITITITMHTDMDDLACRILSVINGRRNLLAAMIFTIRSNLVQEIASMNNTMGLCNNFTINRPHFVYSSLYSRFVSFDRERQWTSQSLICLASKLMLLSPRSLYHIYMCADMPSLRKLLTVFTTFIGGSIVARLANPPIRIHHHQVTRPPKILLPGQKFF